MVDRLALPMFKFNYNKELKGIYAYNEKINSQNIEKFVNNLYKNKNDIFKRINFEMLRSQPDYFDSK
jgi:hypothetical protein